jgi:hypothetical protein
MQELFTFYTPEEINEFIKLITKLVLLVFGTSVGTFTRELLFPDSNTLRQNIGLALVSGFIAFGVMLRYSDVLTLEYSFLICVFLGFFIPVFKNWFKGKKIFKIIFRAWNKTADIATNVMTEVGNELEKEKEED